MDPSMLALIEQFNALDDSLYFPHWPKPTDGSLSRIEAHFGVKLPPLLVSLARNSRRFGQRFASIGPNHDSPQHIIRINSYWRRRRRTRRYVIVTDEHDDNHASLGALRRLTTVAGSNEKQTHRAFRHNPTVRPATDSAQCPSVIAPYVSAPFAGEIRRRSTARMPSPTSRREHSDAIVKDGERRST